MSKSGVKMPDFVKNIAPKNRARFPFGKMVLTQVNVDYVGPSISEKCFTEANVASDELFGTISSFIEQCESPIEKQMAVALFFADWGIDPYPTAYAPSSFGRSYPCLMNRDWDHTSFEPPPALWETVIISPQQRIGNYRADLLVMVVDRVITPNKKPIMAVIECDGRDYHAANEEQVARDKKRDREMQSLGYNVFRFTGSEIFKNSDRCASDVVRFCTSLRDLKGGG